MKALLLRRARELEAAGLVEEAIKVYDELIYKNSGDPALYNLYGDLLLRHNKLREAVEKFYKAEELYEKEKFTEHAIAILKKILRINPGERRALLRLIDLYLGEQLLPEARFYRDLYMTYLEEKRFKVGPIIVLKDLSKLVKQFDNDLDFVKKASQIALEFPERVDVSDFLYSVALIMERNGQTDEAIKLYEEIVRRNPHYYRAYFALGRLTGRNDYFEKAREEAENRLMSESDMDATVVLAEIYMRRNEPERAAGYMLRAGEHALSKNRVDEAKAYFLKAYQTDPTNIEALEKFINLAESLGGDADELADYYLPLARYYLSRGGIRKAREYLEKALELKPGLQSARKILARIEKFSSLREVTFRGRNLLERVLSVEEVDRQTGLPAAYEFYNRLFDMVEQRTPFVMGYIQIDNLSRIARLYGQEAAEQLISSAVHFLKLRLKGAFLSRHDESVFGLILDNTDNVRKVLEQLDWIREEFKSLSFLKSHPEYHATFSAGIIGYDGRTPLLELIKSAEAALALAAKTGDRVVIGEEVEEAGETQLPDLTVFVGRESELKRLLELVEASTSGKISGVVVHGETGIGKSRLLGEFFRRLENTGWYVVKTQGFQHKLMSPFYPFYTGFTEFFGALSGEEKNEIIKATGGYPPIFSDSENRSMEDRHIAFYEWISRFMEFVQSAGKRFIFLIDDVVWMDDPSLELLLYMLRHARPGTFIVMSYNDAESSNNPHVAEAIESLVRERIVDEISLTPFDKKSVREFLLKAMHASSVPEKAVEYFHRETEGNPFLLGELLTMLYEQGNLRPDGDQLVWKEPQRITYTNKLAEIAEKRISMLDESTLEVLQTLSCLGRVFSFETLVELMSDRGEDELLHALEQAQKALIIRESRGFGVDYEFVNDQIRQYIYDRINPVKRKRIHKNIAEHLEKEYLTGKEQLLYEIAYHYFKGEVPDKALFYTVLSGEKALSDYMFPEAVEYFRQAYELHREYPGRLEPDFLLKLFLGYSRSLEVTGRYEEAERVLEEALKVLPDSASIFNALGEIRLARSMFDEALEAFRKAYELSIDDVDKARTLVNIGKTHFIQMNYDEAIRALVEAEQMLLELEEKSLLSEVQLFIGAVMRARGDLSGAKINYKSALDAAASVNDMRREIHALNNLGSVLRSMGELAEAEKVLQDALEKANRISDIRAGIVASNNMGMLLKDRGNLKEAVEKFELVIQKSSRPGYRDSVAIANIELAELHYLMGSFDRAEEHAREAIETAELLGKKHYKALAMRVIALMGIYMGRFKEALETIEEAEKELGSYYSIEYVPLISLARGDYYSRLKKYSEAIFAYRDTLNRVESADIKKVKLMALSSLINIYLEVNELLDAEKMLVEAEMNITDPLIAEAALRYLTARARVNLIKNLLGEALRDIQSALEIISSSGMKLYLPEILLQKAAIEKAAGNMEAAFEALSHAYETATWIRASGILWEIAESMVNMNHPRSPEAEKELEKLLKDFRKQGEEFVPAVRQLQR